MRTLAAGSIVLASCVTLWSAVTLADAVPPPPQDCPKGQIGITSHGGPECVEPAPKNCPPGWRGQIRGVCSVATCTTDAECGAGNKCKEADVCLRETLREWGWQSPDASQSFDRSVLAAPPRHFDPPLKVILTIDVCGNNRSCPAESKCDKGKVCLPSGVTKPGAWKPKRKQ